MLEFLNKNRISLEPDVNDQLQELINQPLGPAAKRTYQSELAERIVSFAL